jgi:pilus assembly protein Flp/PilA
MTKIANRLRRFLTSQDGPTAVEYAAMLALIIVVCLTAISTLGSNAKTSFTNTAVELSILLSESVRSTRLPGSVERASSYGGVDPWASDNQGQTMPLSAPAGN